jgi:hypothetical protein
MDAPPEPMIGLAKGETRWRKLLLQHHLAVGVFEAPQFRQE